MREQLQVPQVLVKWSGCDIAEARWEDKEEIQEIYPNINLEHKVVFKGESNVMSPNNEIAYVAGELVKTGGSGQRGGQLESEFVTKMKMKDLRRSNQDRVTKSWLRDFVWGLVYEGKGKEVLGMLYVVY